MNTRNDEPPALKLGTDKPKVLRLSRPVLVGLLLTLGLMVSGTLIYALQERRSTFGESELYATGNVIPTDQLDTLPRDYSRKRPDTPVLGPRLQGDLGRPIVASAGGPDPTKQKIAQENEAARTAVLFTQIKPDTKTTEQPAESEQGTSATRADLLAFNPAQDGKRAFLNAPTDRRTTISDRVQPAPSPYVVQAGTVIPAALITGIRSDLPGQITAQVTEAAYDSPSGAHLLIPQGARLIGQYDNDVGFGQSRILLVWTRLIMPNGRSIVLERQPGADSEGYAGLEDGVDYHWGNLMKAGLISMLLNVGSELGAGDDESRIIEAIRRGGQDTVSRAGQEIVRKQLNVAPTRTIRPGFPVRVMVTRDLILEPVRRQIIWHKPGCRLKERWPRLVGDITRRACCVASAEVGWSAA